MATMVLTAKAKPIFLGYPIFNKSADNAGDLVCSSGNALRHRLYDMDPASIWASISSSDSIQENIVGGLWDQGVQSAYSIDFFAILGHNLKAFTVEFSADNGATWPNSYAYTAQTENYTLRSLAAAITANKFRILMDTTQVANAEKNVGAIIICLAKFQMTDRPSLYERLPPRVKDKSAKMHNNSTRRSYIYRSDASIHYLDTRVGWVGVANAEANSLDTLLLQHVPFVFAPEPGDRPTEWRLGQAAPNTYQRKYNNLSKAGDWAVSFDFEESGGAT